MFTPLIVLASVTLYCHAESLGPPKGAFGVLDGQYPWRSGRQLPACAAADLAALNTSIQDALDAALHSIDLSGLLDAYLIATLDTIEDEVEATGKAVYPGKLEEILDYPSSTYMNRFDVNIFIASLEVSTINAVTANFPCDCTADSAAIAAIFASLDDYLRYPFIITLNNQIMTYFYASPIDIETKVEDLILNGMYPNIRDEYKSLNHIKNQYKKYFITHMFNQAVDTITVSLTTQIQTALMTSFNSGAIEATLNAAITACKTTTSSTTSSTTTTSTTTTTTTIPPPTTTSTTATPTPTTTQLAVTPATYTPVTDWRYPDHIVDPLVECKTEGVFPHPRDCQWYYRCYDRYGFGFYWRAYFKCEPGTQFSDALDQCVHAGDPRECSPEPPVQPCSNIVDDCNLKQICPAGNLGTAFVKTVEICRTSFTKCPGKPDQAFCEPGSVYDNTNKVCIPENSLCRQSDPRPAPPDIVCEDEIGKCVDLTVCETETSEPRRQRLCNVMYNCVHSDGRKTTRSLCDPEYIFDTDSNECVSREAVASKQCPDTQLVSDVPVTCEKDSESCSLFEACETREMFLSCSSYFNCRETQQMRSDPLCGQTEAYSFKYGRCLSRPTYRQLLQSGGPYSPCLSTGIHPVPFAPDAPVEELIENYTCKALGDTPYAENHPQLRCKEAPACGIAGAQYRATRILCQDYFMCTSGGRNKLRLRRKTCGTGEYFNFTEMICTPEECPDVMPESSSSTTTTTTTPKSTDVNLSLELKIVCSKNGEVPILESNGHMRYCSVNVLCDENNSVLGVKHLCEQFYKCYLDEESGSLKAKLGSCTDPETLYDFSVAACVPKPTNLCKLDVRTRFLNMMEQFGWNFKANTGNEFAPPAFVGQESAISQIPGYTGNVPSYLPAYSNNLPTQQQAYLSNSGNHNQGYYMGNTQTASQLSPTRFQNSGTVYNRAINFPGSEQQRLNMATNPQIQGQQQVNSNFNSYNYNQL